MHRDPILPGYKHLRGNLIVQYPDVGGTPEIEGERPKLGLGDAWVFLADQHLHSAAPVWGRYPRLSVSYGFFVRSEKCEELGLI